MADKNSLLVDCRFISKLQGMPPKPVVYLRKEDVVSLLRQASGHANADQSFEDIVSLAETLERIEQ